MTETTFKQAYDVLLRHAESLRKQSEPNIDQLLTIVTESVEAYKICTARINAVDQALEAALSKANIDDRPMAATSVGTVPRSMARQPASAPPAPGHGEEDDIPF